MNLLIDALPQEVTIDGKDYAVNCDFRANLRTILAFEDNDLAPQEKQSVMIANLYPEIPENAEAAIERAGWFLNGGREAGEDDATGERLYSFAKDANYIYAAFKQTHGISLDEVDLHWWVFMALFADLGADTLFCNLVSLRKRLKDGSATPEERKMAQSLGEIVDVPELDDRTLDEKEAYEKFMELTRQGTKGGDPL